MPRAVVWLLLTVALAGPLLTHAEAADDLARSLAGVRDLGRIEAPDGGVGDDPNVASVVRSAPTVDAPQLAMPAWDSPTAFSPLEPTPPDPDSRRRGASRISRLFPTAALRAAWLQVFLY